MRTILALILGLSILAFAYWHIRPQVMEQDKPYLWTPVICFPDTYMIRKFLPACECAGLELPEYQMSVFVCNGFKSGVIYCKFKED